MLIVKCVHKNKSDLKHFLKLLYTNKLYNTDNTVCNFFQNSNNNCPARLCGFLWDKLYFFSGIDHSGNFRRGSISIFSFYSSIYKWPPNISALLMSKYVKLISVERVWTVEFLPLVSYRRTHHLHCTAGCHLSTNTSLHCTAGCQLKYKYVICIALPAAT